MNCQVITVGTEFLLGLGVDKNSAYIAHRLGKIGINCQKQTSVSDVIHDIVAVIKEALSQVELVVITGGLGPTADDVTRQAISQALGSPLVLEPQLAKQLEKKFGSVRKGIRKLILSQAYLPEGSSPILPTQGSAAGLVISLDDKLLLALPGVPSEMKEMLESQIPFLEKRTQDFPVLTLTVKITGLTEAFVEEKIQDMRACYPKVSIGILAGPGEINLLLTTQQPSLAKSKNLLATAREEIQERLGRSIFSYNEDALEKVVGELLRKHNLKLAVAESCTGGLLSNLITNIAGSSDYFLGGAISYSNEAKKTFFKVPRQIILKEGAVSATVAKAMATEARTILKADISLAVTGIAGPSGGTVQKPVGLTFIALDSKEYVLCERFEFSGSRLSIKQQSSRAALNMLRLFILEEYEPEGDIS